VRILKKHGFALLGTMFGFSVVLATGLVFQSTTNAQTTPPRPPKHVDAKTCAGCHEQAYKTWSSSHHSWALRPADKQNVLANFDNTKFEHFGVTSNFFMRDGRHWVKTQGADGKQKEFEVKYTVGVEPLQQYLVELERGRLQALDIAWDTKKKRWLHLYPKQKISHKDGLHWTGPYKNWQARCAECHQTNFTKGYDLQSKSYQSKWSGLTVGCQSCHGPGEAHLAWAKDPSNSLSDKFTGVNKLGFAHSFKNAKPKTELEVCAKCHSRREAFSANSSAPHHAYADNYNLATLRPGLYHADGQINDEVYVYGSFLQSKMHARGVRCTNCHEPHSGQLKAKGNETCTQCHSPQGNTNFPSLKRADYDSTQHHHHPANSPGAQCANCHMPAKNYMVVDPRRDHSFRVPRPDLSVKLGTPNACASCHQDKSAQWAADSVKQWYPNGRSGTPHFAALFNEARSNRISGQTRDQLAALGLDAKRPAIIRATALDHMRQAMSPEVLQSIAPLLKDENVLVRIAAARLFRGTPAKLRFQYLKPLLEDKTRSVRIAAAREFLNIPPNRIPPADRPVVQRAIKEFQASLQAKSDFPETQLALGGLAMTTRNFRAAQAALRSAVDMDPQLAQGWLTLARIQFAQRRLPAARKTLLAAIEHVPDDGRLHNMLGSVLLQLRLADQSVASFQKAAELLPKDAGVRVALGSALIRVKRFDQAVSALTQARKMDPNNADAIYMLAHGHIGLGDFIKAREYAVLLQTKFPRYRLDRRLQTLLNLNKPQTK